MLDNQRHKLLYDVHGWLGLITGLLLYLVCFSGAVALFAEPIAKWETPAAALTKPADLDRALAALAAHGLSLDGEWRVRWSASAPATLQFQSAGRDRQTLQVTLGATERVQRAPPPRLTDFVRELHNRLLLGRTGRYLLGVLGLVMFVSVIIGVLIHPKLLREAFLFRRGRSLRLALTDLHKLLGTWSLPFTLLMSFTAILLGLAQWLLLAGAVASYRGDFAAAVADYEGAPVVAAGVPAAMPATAPFLAAARAHYPGSEVHGVTLHHWGDKHAQIEISLAPRNGLIMAETVRYSVQTGAITHVMPIAGQGLWHRLYGAIVPLHYATFGGGIVKALYAALALVTAGMIVSGLLVWLERRTNRRAGAASGTQRMIGLIAGLGVGIPLAYGGVFLLAAATPALASALRLPVFFALVLLSCLATMSSRSPWRVLRWLVHSCAAIVLAAAMTQALRMQLIEAVGTTLFLLALLLFYCGQRLPQRLPSRRDQHHDLHRDQHQVQRGKTPLAVIDANRL